MSAEDTFNYDFGYGGIGDVSTGDTSGYNYDFGYGGIGDVSVGDTGTPGAYDPTTVSYSPNVLDSLLRAVLGTQGASGTGAGLALGLGALAAALSRQQAPEIKAPEYKPVPIYNRALTAPLYAPQPAPQTSASGQNIYTPMKGMPLFFNPNPFQFDPTEAAKRYGPTPEQIAQGQAGYEAGLASLYKPLTITPFTYGTPAPAPAPSPAPSPAPAPSGDEVVAGAMGGSVDDIMVGYGGGEVGYNQGGMAMGRYLSGGGDGMSDSIPATINNKQPARLADGEFVVPADVVADLGNGSSNAGAKKLYAMMKKIRQARHGTSKQPPEVKAEKAMPA